MATDRKGHAYKEGRKAGSTGRTTIDQNPFPSYVGEFGDWRDGWTDGWYDIGQIKSKQRELRAAAKKVPR